MSNIDIEQICNVQKSIVIEAHNARGQFIDDIEKVLAEILRRKNYQNLYTSLMYVIHEIVANANKANIKRVFFAENELNINDQDDYSKGIAEFSKMVRDDTYNVGSKLAKYNKFVKFVIHEFSGLNFSLSVVNNSPLTNEEKIRIREKLKRVVTDSFSEEIIDTTEGAGMGLFLSLKLLEQSGIPHSALKIVTDKEKTSVNIFFNYNSVSSPPYHEIALEILNEAGELPRLPESLNKILELTSNKDIEISKVADYIEKDPSITADILKLVNSAQFTLNRKIGAIKEAINFIGLSGLRSLLYSYGAMKAIDNRFGTIPEIWDHCYKTAKISVLISQIKKISDKSDDFFTAGLLHDMGKIVLMNLDKDSANKIEKACQLREINLPVMEEIMMGLSHARIGGEIANLWDFPIELSEAIMYHHDPIMTTDEYKPIVYTVYLANIFANIQNIENIDMLMIEPIVRDYFNIENTDELKEIAAKVLS